MGFVWPLSRLPFEGVPFGVSVFAVLNSRQPVDHIFSHSTLKLTKVNTYGLVFHWQGSNTGLKPILLAAHQGVFIYNFTCIDLTSFIADVVPVHPNTVDQWTHPPYSGYFDGDTPCFRSRWHNT